MESGAGGEAAANMWTAAAAARSWAASAHHLAAWESCQIAWMAMAEASEAGRNNADAGAKAVGEGGRIDAAAFRRGATYLEAAVQAHLRAVAAFTRAAEQARSSEAEWVRANSAHAMAGDAESEAVMRMQVDSARAVADSAAGWARRAARDADTTKKALRKWEKFAAARAGSRIQGGDRTAWLVAQEKIRADAERARAEWSAKAEKAKESVREAEDHVRRYREMVDRAAAMIEQSGGPEPEAHDAADEWGRAQAAGRSAVSAWRTRE